MRWFLLATSSPIIVIGVLGNFFSICSAPSALQIIRTLPDANKPSGSQLKISASFLVAGSSGMLARSTAKPQLHASAISLMAVAMPPSVGSWIATIFSSGISCFTSGQMQMPGSSSRFCISAISSVEKCAVNSSASLVAMRAVPSIAMFWHRSILSPVFASLMFSSLLPIFSPIICPTITGVVTASVTSTWPPIDWTSYFINAAVKSLQIFLTASSVIVLGSSMQPVYQRGLQPMQAMSFRLTEML